MGLFSSGPVTVFPRSRRILPRVRAVTLMAVMMWPALAAVQAQCRVELINSDPDTEWNDMALYRAGAKLFVSDNTGARILAFDEDTLASLGEIPLSAYLPDRPQWLVIHEGTGTLYVIADAGYATSMSRVVVIDADTLTVSTTLPNIGYSQTPAIDESRARLYLFGSNSSLRDTLTAINVTTNTVAGSLDVGTLMGAGLCSLNRDGGLNPATGELVITNLHYDKFVIAQGPAMTGSLIEAASSRGWTGIWNPTENKVVITTGSWGGYFAYDRDTGTPGFAGCVNDGTDLFFSALTDRVYSGAEIDGNVAVIEGATDACQEVSVGGGLPAVGFAPAKHHAYITGWDFVRVLSEDNLSSVATFEIPGPSGGGVVGCQAIVDPVSQRVFIRSFRDLSEGVLSCVLVLDDLAPIITTQPQPQTVRAGETAALSVAATGVGTLHYQWYQGERRDTTQPVGTDSAELTTPPLSETALFWVRVSDDNGSGDSDAAHVTVDPAPGTWSAQDSHTTEELYDVFFLNADLGWVVGDWGTIRKTTNGGADWVTQSAGTTRTLQQVWFSTPDVGWVVANLGTIYKTTDGGASWVPQTSNTSDGLYGVAFVDSATGWAVGASATILKTTNGGSDWNAQSSGIYDWLYDVCFLNAETGWAVGYNGVIIHTTNGGAVWLEQSSGTTHVLQSVDFVDAGNGWTVGGSDGGRIFHTTDGGETWTRQAEDWVAFAWNGVDFVDDSQGWAVGTGRAILKTVDGGVNWYRQASGVGAPLQAVRFLNAGTGWAVGNSGTILKFTRDYDVADFNHDFAVDTLDLQLLAEYLAGNASLPFGTGDVNGDGSAGIVDLVTVLRRVSAL